MELESTINSQVTVTFTAKNISLLGKESFSNQRGRASCAGEAALVPLAIFKGNVFAASKTCDGFSTGCTFLGIQVPKALEAVRRFLSGGEVLASQLSLASTADKAFLVIRLLMVGYPSFGQSLLAVEASWSKVVLVARHTVNLTLVRHKGL